MNITIETDSDKGKQISAYQWGEESGKGQNRYGD